MVAHPHRRLTLREVPYRGCGYSTFPARYKIQFLAVGSLKIDGSETIDVLGIEKGIKPTQDATMVMRRKNEETAKESAVDAAHRYADGDGLLPARRDLAPRAP